jgi:hypothetical protein
MCQGFVLTLLFLVLYKRPPRSTLPLVPAYSCRRSILFASSYITESLDNPHNPASPWFNDVDDQPSCPLWKSQQPYFQHELGDRSSPRARNIMESRRPSLEVFHVPRRQIQWNDSKQEVPFRHVFHRRDSLVSRL